MNYATHPQSQPNTPLSDRSVVVIQAEHDCYFSGHGAFDTDFATRLRTMGVNASQNTFSSNPLRIHPRAWHACPIGWLTPTGPLVSEGGFPIAPGQNAASAIVHNIFMGHIKND